MRRIGEAAAEGDLRHRLVCLGGIREVLPAAEQAAVPQGMGEAVARCFEEPVEVALGDAVRFRGARRREIGLVEMPLDGAMQAAQQRRLRGGGAPGLATRRGGVPQKGEQHLGDAGRYGVPFGFGQSVERLGRRGEAARQHARQAVGRHDQGGVEGIDPAAAKSALPRRQDQRPAVALEQETAVAGPGQQRDPARGDVPALPAEIEARARLLGHEEERRAGPSRDCGQGLTAAGEPRDRDPIGLPAHRSGGVGVPCRGREVGTEAERADQVLPGRTTLAVGIGLAGEPADAHGPI